MCVIMVYPLFPFTALFPPVGIGAALGPIDVSNVPGGRTRPPPRLPKPGMDSTEQILSRVAAGSTFGRFSTAWESAQSMVLSDPHGDPWTATQTRRVSGKIARPHFADEQ